MAAKREASEPQVLYLTTTGRKTGLPREVEIWFVRNDGKLYILAEHFFKTHWVQNILKNPRVRIRLSEREFPATGRVLDPEQDASTYHLAQDLERKKYGWGEGLPVEFTPDALL